MAKGRADYEVRVRGHQGRTMRIAFPEFRIHIDDGDTVLSGALADQASVSGVLAAMESLGLELLEMRRVMPA